MNGLLSALAKHLEDSKNDLRTRISDRRRPMDDFAMRSCVFLKEHKNFFLLPFSITVMIIALLLSLAVWTHEPVVAPSDDVFVLGD